MINSKSKIMEWPLEDLKKDYKDYLDMQELLDSTKLASMSDAFYIWRKRGKETFWDVVSASEFEELGRAILLETLKEHSRGKAERNVNSYLTHLRRFRNYLESKSLPEESKPLSSLKAEVKDKSNKKPFYPRGHQRIRLNTTSQCGILLRITGFRNMP